MFYSYNLRQFSANDIFYKSISSDSDSEKLDQYVVILSGSCGDGVVRCGGGV